MTEFLPILLTQPMNRQRYSREFKRQIVETSLAPGASIAAVAQAHGINANLLHKWRWRYRNGEYGAVAEPSALATLQMVKSATLAVANQHQPTTIRTETTSSSAIELFFNNTRVLVHGAPDSQTLRSIIEVLRT